MCRDAVGACEHSDMTATIAERIPALLEELDRYPDDRGEIVFEFEQAGDQESALQWLQTLVDAGGVDGALARVEIASIHLQAGRDDLATAQLAALRAARVRDPEPYAMAGELFAARGDEPTALVWFSMAAARFSDDQLAAAVGEHGWASSAYGVLWQRRQLRHHLGYVPDDLDAGLVAPPFGPSAFPSVEQALADGLPGGAQRLRILIWPQPEFVLAKQRWPRLLDEAVSHTEYRARLESQLRDTTTTGPVKIDLIAVRVDALHDYAVACGGSVHDAQVRRGYLDEQARLGHAVTWPPGRDRLRRRADRDPPQSTAGAQGERLRRTVDRAPSAASAWTGC
jgi:hypothetical protein